MVEIFVHVLILILFVIGFYFLLQSSTLVTAAKQNMGDLYVKLHKRNEVRVQQVEKLRREYGTGTTDIHGKGSFWLRLLSKIDDLLVYSQAGIRYGWLNATTYLVLNVTVGSSVFLLTIAVTGNLLISFLCTMLVVLTPLVYMYLMRVKNYRMTEEDLTFFISMVANTSLYTTDLVTILDIVSEKAKEPVRSAIGRAIVAADVAKKNRTDVCVSKLTREVEHPLFVRYIRNLEICSRKNADYAQISKDYSVQVGIVIDNTENQRVHYAGLRNVMVILAVLFLVAVVLVTNMVEMSLLEVFQSMCSSILGQLVLFAELVLWGIPVFYIIAGSRR